MRVSKLGRDGFRRTLVTEKRRLVTHGWLQPLPMALVLAFSANHETLLLTIEHRPKHIGLAADLAVFDILLDLTARFVDLIVVPLAAVATLKP
jgi:hypothetical protein